MRKTVFCPNFLASASPQEIVDVLYKVSLSESNVKVAVDRNLVMLDRYARQNDQNALVSTWIDAIINNFPDRLARVIEVVDSSNLSDQALAVEIAKALQVNRDIVVNDSDDYLGLASLIKLAGIRLLEKGQAHQIFLRPYIFDFEKLTIDLVAIAHRLTERKSKVQSENSTNDIVVDMLRTRGFGAWDQTRSGKATVDAGELDIAERRSDGVIESIVEAFRLNSCGKKNVVIAQHLDKLIHGYDSSGVTRSFVLVYAEAPKYANLWQSYLKYVENINSHKEFGGPHKLLSIVDMSKVYSCSAGVRVALAKHSRDLVDLEVVHVFINMAK